MPPKAVASHGGPPSKSTELPPNQALYLKNLQEKIAKQDMRMALYMLFSVYGTVLDIVVLRNGKMRGQAHVVFKDIQGSTQAMRGLQGFDLFGKELKIEYGKGRSNVFTRLEGVYKPPNAPDSTSTELQQSIFNAPAVTASTTATSSHPLPPAPAAAAGSKTNDQEPHGTKRTRDEESDDEEASMDEEDDDVSMEASSDDE